MFATHTETDLGSVLSLRDAVVNYIDILIAHAFTSPTIPTLFYISLQISRAAISIISNSTFVATITSHPLVMLAPLHLERGQSFV